MEPASTLAEIARILRPGGLFAAYEYDFPPALNWELEQVYQEVDQRLDELMQERGHDGLFSLLSLHFSQILPSYPIRDKWQCDRHITLPGRLAHGCI
jgi:SAM-dependent methyltransferase